MAFKVTVIGPSGAGKTVLLAATLATPRAIAPRDLRVLVTPHNQPARELGRAAVDLLRGELPSASVGTTSYAFHVALCGAKLFNLGAEKMELTMIDTPGGNGLPMVNEDLNEEVVRSLNESRGVLLVLGCDENRTPKDLPERMERLFSAVLEARGDKAGRFLFERLAVVMTMADVLTDNNHGVDSLNRLDPKQTCTSRVPNLLPVFTRYVAPGGSWFFLTSAFGFRRSDGGKMAVKKEGVWVLEADERGGNDNWRPYGLQKPLEFLARGFCRYRKDEL